MGSTTPTPSTTTRTSRADATYVVTGTRGSTVDLSFQVLGGDYSPRVDAGTARRRSTTVTSTSPTDGSFEWRFGPRARRCRNGSTLIVREVYDDWDAERAAHLASTALDTLGAAVGDPLTPERPSTKRYAVAAKMLIGRIQTWFAFPEWFYLNEPVNTLTEPAADTRWAGVAVLLGRPLRPRRRRGDGRDRAGLATAPYLAIQLGTRLVHLARLRSTTRPRSTAARRRSTPTGCIRFVVSERDPGVANWVELCRAHRGYLQFRWQRLDGRRSPPRTVRQVRGGDRRRRSTDTLPYYEGVAGDAPSSGPSASRRGSVGVAGGG